MTIDFNSIPQETIKNFKGGEGEILTRNFVDDDNRIMFSVLKPGSSSGYHKHESNCEVIYILKGEITFTIDGKKEIAKAGQAHYCPNGSSHSMKNESKEDAVYFAIVPNLNK